MKANRLIFLTLVLGVALGAGGCADQAAFIYNPDEFNRESATYAKEPEDIEDVIICYSRRVTSQQEVTRMAQAECAKFNKTARFTGIEFLECPVLTPGGAQFDCVGF
jgi:hypothetical protein